MNRVLSMMIGGACALLIGTSAYAATTSGAVVTTDALTNTITIQTEDGRRFLFTRNADTKIEQEGVGIALGDIRKDSRVTVTTEQAPTDPQIPMLASRVQVDEMAVATAPTSASVESADMGDGAPVQTAQVESADAERSAARLPRTATPLPLLTVVGTALLGSGLLFGLRRQRR